MAKAYGSIRLEHSRMRVVHASRWVQCVDKGGGVGDSHEVQCLYKPNVLHSLSTYLKSTDALAMCRQSFAVVVDRCSGDV